MMGNFGAAAILPGTVVDHRGRIPLACPNGAPRLRPKGPMAVFFWDECGLILSLISTILWNLTAQQNLDDKPCSPSRREAISWGSQALPPGCRRRPIAGVPLSAAQAARISGSLGARVRARRSAAADSSSLCR